MPVECRLTLCSRRRCSWLRAEVDSVIALPLTNQDDDDDDEGDWHPSVDGIAGSAADADAADDSVADKAADDSMAGAQAEDSDSGDVQIPWYSRLWRALHGVKPDPTSASTA
jgi:hypothetical protein